jgi:hypothetical protein
MDNNRLSLALKKDYYYWVFGVCPSRGILICTKHFGKLDLFLSSGGKVRNVYSVGPFRES